MTIISPKSFLFLLFIVLILSQVKLHIDSIISLEYLPTSVATKDDDLADLPTQHLQKLPPFCRSLAYSRGSTSDSKMVHAFVSNLGHLDFLNNALLSMERSQLKDWTPVVFALGPGVCQKIASFQQKEVVCIPYFERLMDQLQRDEPKSVKQIRPYLFDKMANATEKEPFLKVIGSFHTWGSVEHKFMINAKLYVLRDILDCLSDAFITDVDVAFARDPRPYFTAPDHTIFAQNDTSPVYQLSLNSGLMYWKSTQANRKLIQDIIKIPPFWWIDQSRVNTVMHNQSTPHTLLDVYEFPNGNIIKTHSHRLFMANTKTLISELVVIAHANWNEGSKAKREMLESIGLWYLEDDEEQRNETTLSSQ